MPDSTYRLRYHKAYEVLRRWDPIGVLADPACPRDEYDSYARSSSAFSTPAPPSTMSSIG